MDDTFCPASLDEARTFFAHDRFATDACGCEIVTVARGEATCMLRLTPLHRNARGAVMGGAIFTLADFALAVASNVDSPPTVSVSNTIEFLASTCGSQLTAHAHANRDGRTLAFFTVDVTDELGALVARMEATCLRRRCGAGNEPQQDSANGVVGLRDDVPPKPQPGADSPYGCPATS